MPRIISAQFRAHAPSQEPGGYWFVRMSCGHTQEVKATKKPTGEVVCVLCTDRELHEMGWR
jgi:hypothetical protein